MADKLRPILEAYLAGGMPPNIALMRLCMEAASPEDVSAAVHEAERRCQREPGPGAGPLSRLGEGQGEGGALSGDGGPSPHPSPEREREPVAPPAPHQAADRLAALARLLDRHSSAWATIRAVMAEAEHERPAGSEDEAVAHWSAVFDRLARTLPEAGVALYALGSPELLDCATAEIVAALDGWGLLGPNTRVLDIGCGIGRFVRALAPLVASVTGTDLSREMIAVAQERCAGLPNARLEVSTGRDLAGLADRSFDLVLAADVFPYLVQAGGELAARHIADAARVLRPCGVLAILNYSYRADLDLDRRDLERAQVRAGFVSIGEPETAFQFWDGAVFLLRKPA